MAIRWFKNAEKTKNEAYQEDEIIQKCSVYYIPCDKIRPNAMRARTDFDEDKLVALAYSIKKYGIIEPLCVRATDSDDSYDYELVVGERRLRAARLLGFSSVPCIITDVSEQISAEFSLIENIFRAELDYFEVACALKRIVELGEDSFEELAARLSISQNELVRKLWLLELGYEERMLLLESGVEEDIAVEIARISNKNARIEAIKHICDNNMSASAIKNYLSTLDSGNSLRAVRELSRDVTSAITGISRRIEFLNRRRERAEMTVDNESDGVYIRIRIRD